MSSIWRKTYRVVGFMLGLGAAVAHAGAPADNTLFFLTPTLNSWNGGRIEMRVTKNTNHPSAGVTVITGVSFWYNATTPSQTGATPVAKMTLTSGAFDSKPIVLTIDPAFYIIAKVDYTKGGMADTITLGDTGINPSYGAHLIKVDNEPPKPATIKWIGLNFPDVAAPDDRYYRDYDFWKGFSKDRLFWSVPQSKYNAAGQPWYYQVKAESTYGTDPQQMTRLYVCSYHIPINWVESDIPTLPPQDYTAADADGVNPAFVKEARTPAYLRDASDGTGSGIAGVIIEVGQKPPNTYTVGTTVTTNYRAKTDVYLNNGETTSNTTAYWIATTTIDNAGNRAETLHFGPIWFVKSPAILCPGNQTASTGPANCTYTHSGTAWDPTPGPETTMALTYQYTLSGAGGVPATGSSLNGVTFNKGVTTVEWIGYDHCGNASNTCTFTVTIADHVPPTITCPSNLNNVPADAGECYATGLTLGTPSVWDNCGIEPGYPVNNAPTQFPLGTTIVTWTVMDTSGNTATCQQSVTVTDQQDPDIVCPATKTVSANANCQYTLGDYRGEAVTDDNCDPAVVVTQSPVPGTVVGIGDTTVTLRATDDAGNSSQCSFIVRVVDTTVPTISCPANEEVPGDADCEAILGDYRTSATVDDNCDALGVTVSQNPAPGTSFSGTVTVTLTATDAAGNHASCQFTVTVIDDSDPEISCPADKTVSADANCEYALGDYTGEATTDDNCDDDVEVTQSPAPGTVVGLGDTTVTLTATDDAGNQDTCSFTVTVEDTSDPTISCPADKTVSADANCEYALGSYCGEATADDNCDGDLDCVQTPSPGTVIGLGDTTVTLTVTDDAGNSASCSFTVTVVDDTDPTISCPPDDEVAGDADCGAILGDYRASASVHDNCGRPTVTQDPAPGTSFSGCTDVTLTVEDGAGNTASCTFKVCVVDETDPTISCPADDEVPGDANCQAVLGDYTDQATTDDNCDDDVEVTQSPAPGYVFSGMVEVTLTATDDTGNTDSCFFYVFVTDETDPTITCPEDKTVSADSNCEFKLPDYTGEATVDDNCDDDVEVTQSPAPGTVIGLGPQTVTLTAEDDAGNTASCSFTVTVVDDTDPNISCPTAVAPLSADDNCEALLPDYCPNASAYDNCDQDLDCEQSPAAGTAVGLGDTTVTLTVTDDAGNSDSCSFTVTVIDDSDPTIACPADKNVSADDNCEFELPDYTNEAVTDDNCDGDVEVTQMPAPGTKVGLGPQTVVLTATDDAGNWDSCSFTVTVVDETDPTITCPPNDEVLGDADCEAILDDYSTSATVDDNCGTQAVTVTQSPSPGTSFSDCITVTLTAEDAAGNTASCTFEVCVIDETDPTITCPGDDELTADENCEAGLPDYTGDASVDDNCDDDVEVTQSPASGTLVSGTTLVTLTATDDAGNSSSCEFNVTVVDKTGPEFTQCPDDATISCLNNTYEFTVCAEDNCGVIARFEGTIGGVPVTFPTPTGGCATLSYPFPAGDSEVVVTAYDDSGNASATCTFTVTVENTLSLEAIPPKCKEDLTDYNVFNVLPIYGCEPLVQLIFVVCFDATRLEYRPPCMYGNGAPHLTDSEVVLLDDGASDGIGEVLVRYDNPSGEPADLPTLQPIAFRVRERAPDGEAEISVCRVVFITGADGKERKVATSGTSVTVGGCVSTLDVSGDGCVTELDGLIIYRVLKYGQFNGLVPIVPPMERMMNCNLPPDEWLIAQVMALGTLPPTVDLNVDDNAGSWDDALINAARDAVYIYRYLANPYDPDLADLIVPTAHTDTYLIRTTILTNIEALDDRCSGGTAP